MSVSEKKYCAYHPTRETALTCASCGKPICVDCVVQTAVAGKCRDCARGPKNPLTRLGPHHYLIALAVATATGTVGGLIAVSLGFFLLMFFIGPTIGGMIGEAVRRAVGRRYGLGLAVVAAIGIFAGLPIAGIILGGAQGAVAVFFRPAVWVYLIFSLPTAWWRLR